MNDFARMIAETAASAGVSSAEVEQWRRLDWEWHLAQLEAQQAATVSACDRAEAAIAEATACGCRIEVHLDDDLQPVIGTERVRHTCGGSS